MSNALTQEQTRDTSSTGSPVQNLIYLNRQLVTFIKYEKMPNSLCYSSLYILGVCLNSKRHCYYASHSNTAITIGVAVSTVRRALFWMVEAEWLLLDDWKAGITKRYKIHPDFYSNVFGKHEDLPKGKDAPEDGARFRLETDAELTRRVTKFYKLNPKERKSKKLPTRRRIRMSETEIAEKQCSKKKLDLLGSVKSKACDRTDDVLKHKDRDTGSDTEKANQAELEAAFPGKKKRREFMEASTADLMKQYALKSNAGGVLFNKIPDTMQEKIIAAAKGNDVSASKVYTEMAKDYGMPIRKPSK